MSNHRQWLFKELEAWLAEGLVSSEQAERLRQRYAASAEGGNSWGLMIFGGFGAVVAGLGIILMFAYNWQAMPKDAKLAVVFGALALAHLAGTWLRRLKHDGMAEAAHLLGSMMFGAGIWLVAQIYHLSAHYPNAFFAWGIGALLLAWALPSALQGILACAILCIWAGAETFQFHSPMYLAPILMGVGILWLAWRQQSKVLFACGVLALGFCEFVCCGHRAIGQFWPAIIALIAVQSLAMARLLQPWARHLPQAIASLRHSGTWIFYGLLYLVSYRGMSQEIIFDEHRWHWNDPGPVEIAWLLLLAATALVPAGLAIAAGLRNREAKSASFWFRLLLPAAWLLLIIGMLLAQVEGGYLIPWIVSNLLFLAGALAAIHRGIRSVRFSLVLLGSCSLALLVLGRYFDLIKDLFFRGAVFIAIGAGLFAVAWQYQKARHQKLATTKEG